ncbi:MULTISPECIES: hypothetical protein [Clostridium]|uniref:hypothetical protein n=1 Tax=Clostridium TaxID=1485 RepID=UPI001111A19B|nr:MULTISPECIES: hypothetical protein [Clostridium]
MHRKVTRKNLLSFTLSSIEFEDEDEDITIDTMRNFGISNSVLEDAKKHKDKYVVMSYCFKVHKKLNNVNAGSLHLEPNFPNVGADATDNIEDMNDFENPVTDTNYDHIQIVVIKTNGLSKKELIKRAKKYNTFTATYKTYGSSGSILTYFPESQTVKCSK